MNFLEICGILFLIEIVIVSIGVYLAEGELKYFRNEKYNNKKNT